MLHGRRGCRLFRFAVEIIRIQFFFQQQQRGDPARDARHFAGFFDCKGAVEDVVLAIRQPLLDDLVAADGVLPDARGDVRPEGDLVEKHVKSLFAESVESFCRGSGLSLPGLAS